MKHTSRFALVFALLLVASTMLASTTLGRERNTSRTEATAAIHASTNITQQTIVTTDPNGTLRSSSFNAFTSDDRALRSRPFTMPEPTQYVISIFHGFGSIIRKAPIKRKGNVQG